MLERFLKTSEDAQPPPPPPPSWAQMEEDLRNAAPSDVVFSNMEVHTKHDDEDSDCSEEAIAVFKRSRELFLANRSLEKSSQALQEHQESLCESVRNLKNLLEEVREKAKGALQHTT